MPRYKTLVKVEFVVETDATTAKDAESKAYHKVENELKKRSFGSDLKYRVTKALSLDWPAWVK